MTVQSTSREYVNWYEATLPVKERKSLGHFSTPPRLVQHILDACGYTPDNHLANRRVLDPACGSGNFLLEAAHRLLTFGKRTGLSPQEITTLMQRNIWGFDPDPVSCFLAEMQLRALGTGDVGGIGNAMEVEGVVNRAPTLWHIHQADGLALPWGEEAYVDLFLANPPYLATKNTDLTGYRSALQRGQTDSYLLFLSLGLHIVRPGGWLGLVLPDPVLARANAAAERTRLLQDFTISHLWHLANVFMAQVGAVVIIAQKHPPHSTHHVAWVRGKWHNVGAQFIAPFAHTRRDAYLSEEGAMNCAPTSDIVRTVPQSLFLNQPNAELRYLLNTEQGSIVQRLHTHLAETSPQERRFAPLSEFLVIRRGEEMGHKSPLLIRTSPCGRPHGARNMYPVLRGGKDVRPYSIAFDHWWMADQAISKPLERYLAPKLLVVKSTNQLQAALDTQGHIALQTLYLLYPHSPGANLDDLYFFLALLNARLLQQYVYILHTAYKWVQPQIEQHVLAHLPVPLVAARQKQEIIANAQLLSRACGEAGRVVEWNAEIQRLYEEQECAVCALYDAALPGLCY